MLACRMATEEELHHLRTHVCVHTVYVYVCVHIMYVLCSYLAFGIRGCECVYVCVQT